MGALVVSKDPREFRALVEPFLLEREAENNLLFGILHGIERGRYTNPLLSYLEEGGHVTAVAIRTPPFKLVLSTAPVELMRVLAELLDPDLPGVNAQTAQARVFADAWTARTGGAVEREMAQRMYALTAVRAPVGVPGRARLAAPADRDLLIEWMQEFELEALGPDDANAGRTAERADWYLTNVDSGILVWEVEGVPVSLAGHSGPTPNGMRVGPVYTPPLYRGRGYAGACVAELSERMLASGRRFCFLYTDLANPTSNSIYQRIGYEPVCDAATYRFAV